MDIQRELKNDLTSIIGALGTNEGILVPLKEVERLLLKRIEQAKDNEVLDIVIESHLKALTTKIEESHGYGFDDVLLEYLDSI